jgi:ABC-type transport system involved in multi-copper enzyme maturation permease subunit
MKTSKILFILFLPFIFAFTPIADDISQAFKSGQASKLAPYFTKQVDLTLLDEDAIVPKAQAQKKLQAFFDQNPPTDFKILHSGKSKTGLEYSIGTLSTKNGEFRVSLYMKKDGGKLRIQQLMIDKD